MVKMITEKVVTARVTTNRVVTFLQFLIMLLKLLLFVVKITCNNIPAIQKCQNSRTNNNYQIYKNDRFQKCQISKMPDFKNVIFIILWRDYS